MPKRTLAEEVTELVAAGFSGIWVATYDVYEACTEITALCSEHEWRLHCWDNHEGFSVFDYGAHDQEGRIRPSFAKPTVEARSATGQTEVKPISMTELPEALDAFIEYASGKRPGLPADKDGIPERDIPSILLLKNPHLIPPQHQGKVLQYLENEATAGRVWRRHIICISTQTNIPREISKQYMLVEHPLPDRQKILDVLSNIELDEEQVPDELTQEKIVDACRGLTPVEAGDAMALSVIRKQSIDPREIWPIKAQVLQKAKGLSLWRGTESFKQLGGMNNLKQFCLRSIQNSQPDNPLMQAKGVLLLGVPGSGKSAFAKALGHETGRPTIRLDVGALMGQYVGQTEGNTRDAIQVIDAMAPAVLMIDEVEKALGAGQHAHEVSTRMMGTFLSWLQDHTSDIFVMCTCNDIHKLTGPHPEFARIGRFDGVFFVDLPVDKEKEAIWKIHLSRYAKYGLDTRQERPSDVDWTGAEIEGCCKLSAMHKISLVEAAENIVPVAQVSDTVQSLREWAKDRCLSALHDGKYRGPAVLQKQASKMSFSNGTRKIKKRRRRPPPDQVNPELN